MAYKNYRLDLVSINVFGSDYLEANYNVLLKCTFTSLFGNCNYSFEVLLAKVTVYNDRMKIHSIKIPMSDREKDKILDDARDETIRILEERYERNDRSR